MNTTDGISWLRILLAFAIVSGLLALLGYGLKYIAQNQIKIPGFKTSNRRLEIVENLAIDSRRRLTIVRCGANEHLLLLGGTQDIVVEANLQNRNNAVLETHVIDNQGLT